MLNQVIVNSVMRSLKAGSADSLDVKRGAMFNEALKLTANANGGTANVLASLRMVLQHDQELFDNVASVYEQRGNSVMRNAYNRLFTTTGHDGVTPFARASAIDADAGNGDADFATLFVEKTIKKQVEADSGILKFVDYKRMATKSGKFPKSSNLAKAAFATVSADLTDLTDTIDDGFDKTEVECEKFGGTMFLEGEVFAKFDEQVVVQILDELSVAYMRGMHDQIYNGNGTSPNATGMFTNATAIGFSGNVTTTLIKMIASVADSSRGGMKDLFVVTNSAGAITMHGDKFINLAYNDLIEGIGGLNFLKSLPVIEDNVLVTSGTSPAKTAPILVGKKGDYLVAVNSEPVVEIDKYSDFKAAGQTARILGYWTGKPHFNASFSKSTIPSIY